MHRLWCNLVGAANVLGQLPCRDAAGGLRRNGRFRSPVPAQRAQFAGAAASSRCGVLVFDSVSRRLLLLLVLRRLRVIHHLSRTTLAHTIFHTQLCHTPLCHTPSFTHLLSHTTFSHTQLCHTPSYTHNFATHHLSHTQLCHTPSFTHHLSHTTLSGVALGDVHHCFAWQAWHLATSTFVSRGRRGTGRHLPSLCVAGVALMALGWLWWRAWAGIGRWWRRGTLRDLRGRRGTWAWHLETSTFVLRGRRGTYGALGLGLVAGDAAALCVAGVALGDLHLRFTWQAWHLEASTFVLRGRCGTYGTGWLWWRAWAGIGPVTPRHFAWQAWHLATSTFVSREQQAWHLETSTFVLRGRRGAYGTGLALVAPLGLDWSPVTLRHFAC